MWKSISELSYLRNIAWDFVNLHAIEPMRSRRQRRVDGVRCPNLISTQVRPGGRIYVTQTYQKRAAPVMRVVKPLLRYVTTIDFGRLTSTAEAERIFRESELELVEHASIAGSVDTVFQTAFRTVLRVPK